MKNLKVGEYIRTSTGRIEKITGIYKNDGFVDTDKEVCVDFVEIAKHSKNIIDLIEVGDYVNGVRIEMIENGITGFGVDEGRELFRNSFKYNPINSILTHEQFEANAYGTTEYRIEKESDK